MPDVSRYDAIVVGSGPNGLAAAITLARAGRSVLLLEAKDDIGGGLRSAELTLPGFLHDICAAIHPLAVASPFFRTLDLEQHGFEWVYPPAALAHPLDDGTAVMLERSIEETAEGLGTDGAAYRRLMTPLVRDWDALAGDILGPLRPPRHPLATLRFARNALRSARGLAEGRFRDTPARGLFAGIGAHSILPLEHRWSAAYALMLGAAAHAVGWPIARGGSQSIANALASCLRSLGGVIETGISVTALDELAGAHAVIFDVTPRQLLGIAGHRLPTGYRRQLEGHRYGPGVFKMDWALDAPIPWQAPGCARAATVHIGGRLEDIATSERSVAKSDPPRKPLVILAQPSLFDPTRAPAGKHTVWGYCHVPNGWNGDMTEQIEAQIERFAPGFRSLIIGRNVMSPRDLEETNPNHIGGDIAGGAMDFGQLFLRPALRRNAYSTPMKGLYICSSSTPPGGGVHGMCGYHAARAALRDTFGTR